MKKRIIILALDYITAAATTLTVCGLSRDTRTLIMNTPPIIWLAIAASALIASSILSVMLSSRASQNNKEG